MSNIRQVLVTGGCVAVLLAGCSKKEEDTSAAAAPVPARANSKVSDEKIPGEKEFRAALNEKNYSGAVDRLNGMQPLLATDEQRDHWSMLFGELRSTLNDASAKDPKAAEALMQLRQTRNGR